MASIDRTAYPRLNRNPSAYQLAELFTISEEEKALVLDRNRGRSLFLTELLLLKCFKRLRYFPKLNTIPQPIIDHIRFQLGMDSSVSVEEDEQSIYWLHKKIRSYLDVQRCDSSILSEVAQSVEAMAIIRDDPVDLINIALAEFSAKRYELPAFRTIHDLVIHIRTRTNILLFSKLQSVLPEPVQTRLNTLLDADGTYPRSCYDQLKQLPKSATLSHLKEWLDHLHWLESFSEGLPYLSFLPQQKVSSFAEEAMTLDAGEMKDLSNRKRVTFILCLIQHMTTRTRDNLIEMFLKRMFGIHTSARERMEEILRTNRSVAEELIEAFYELLQVFETTDTDGLFVGVSSQEVIEKFGGLDYLLNGCATVNAYKNNNYLPLLWSFHKSHRSTLFRVLQAVQMKSTTEDQSLIKAWKYLLENRMKRSDCLPYTIDVGFASERWKRLMIQSNRGNEVQLKRREFEVCTFSNTADDLKSGDLCIGGSYSFADYRDQLFSWNECKAMLSEYCSTLKLPNTNLGFVQTLRTKLIEKANEVDEGFTENEELLFNEKGEPKLKKLNYSQPSLENRKLVQLIHSRMPERNILDILCNVEHWTRFTRHFTPSSGSDPKLSNPVESYLFTAFTYGCNLGPVQMAKHTRQKISAHTLSYINSKHVSATKLDQSNVDILNVYNRFKLPSYWGDGSRVAVDGTKIEIYDQNLMAEYHIRYGGYGGIAYHHVADTYVALFSHFIPCGVWEAIYIIDGLLKNQSDIQPTIVHGDTQAQSTTVFGLSYLLGIELMPRIRNWKDLILFRPTTESKYEHIDALFGDPIDWNLIETHWKDMMQVVLSIYKGKISSAVILRKLGNYSRKNKLYKAFQELGRVIRTLFLLQYVSDPHLRRIIHATTNKAESYNFFSEQLRFGGYGILRTNDPIEQEKRIKYNDLIANAVMLQNVSDMTNVINELTSEGYRITPEVLKLLSPYILESVKRFGEYRVDLSEEPPPLYEFLDIENSDEG